MAMDSGRFIQAGKTRKPGGAVGSCPAAEQRVHRRPATLKHVGIDLRGLDVVVPHQLLHRADVIAPFQQVGGGPAFLLALQSRPVKSAVGPFSKSPAEGAASKLGE